MKPATAGFILGLDEKGTGGGLGVTVCSTWVRFTDPINPLDPVCTSNSVCTDPPHGYQGAASTPASFGMHVTSFYIALNPSYTAPGGNTGAVTALTQTEVKSHEQVHQQIYSDVAAVESNYYLQNVSKLTTLLYKTAVEAQTAAVNLDVKFGNDCCVDFAAQAGPINLNFDHAEGNGVEMGIWRAGASPERPAFLKAARNVNVNVQIPTDQGTADCICKKAKGGE